MPNAVRHSWTRTPAVRSSIGPMPTCLPGQTHLWWQVRIVPFIERLRVTSFGGKFVRRHSKVLSSGVPVLYAFIVRGNLAEVLRQRGNLRKLDGTSRGTARSI